MTNTSKLSFLSVGVLNTANINDSVSRSIHLRTDDTIFQGKTAYWCSHSRPHRYRTKQVSSSLKVTSSGSSV